MRERFLFLATVMLLAGTVSVAQSIEATTTDGRKVLLKADGTWQFVQNTDVSAGRAATSFGKPGASAASLTLKGQRFVIWYDSSRWIQQTSDDPSRFEFSHKDGDVYAVVIAERIPMRPELLRDMAIRNAQEASPDAKVIFDESRVVNGTELQCMKIQGTIEGINFIYYGYYYTGNAGTIQVLTFTSSNLFAEYEQQMLDFLNGTVVQE